MSANDSPAIAAMKRTRAEILSRLKQNEDYRALVALDKAIAEVAGISQEQPFAWLQSPSMADGIRPLCKDGMRTRTPSQPEAVAMVLNEHGPQPTSALLELIKGHGVEVSGADPLINLSSSISKSGLFRSTRINSVPHWWFKDRELPRRRSMFPDNLVVGETTDVGAPAADNSTNEKGGDEGAAA